MSGPCWTPLGYSRIPQESSKPNKRFEKMQDLNQTKCSNFNPLPTELILEICERLSTHDLWYSIRPTSRLLATCARELLPRKFFQENSIHITWCCFWCSLGHHCLSTACSPITKLFPDATNVRIATINSQALMIKAIFGSVCDLVTSLEPRIRIRLGEEERDVTFRIGEILPQSRKNTGDSAQDLQLCQHELLVWYFAKQSQESARGRFIGFLGFAAHLLRFFAISIALVVTGSALALILLISIEGFKLLTNSYKCLRSMVRFCLGIGLLLHQEEK